MKKYIFGDKKDFALEYIVTAFYKNKYIGTIRYWINGDKYGNDSECLLTDSMHFIKNMYFYCGKRMVKCLSGKEHKELCRILNDENIYEKCQCNPIPSIKYDLSMDISPVMDINIYFLQNTSESILLYQDEDKEIQVKSVEGDKIERIIYEVYTFVESMISDELKSYKS